MSFQSVHDLLVPPGIVRKQKFWDFFDGDSLRSWWNVNSTGSNGMVDTVDEGYFLTTGTADNNRESIDHNDINHYSATGATCIFVMRNTETTLRRFFAGFKDSESFGHYAVIDDDTDNGSGNVELVSRDGSSTGAVDLGLSLDETFHKWQLNFRTSSVLAFRDNVLSGLATSNLPTTAQQLNAAAQTRTTAARTAHIRYFEAFNT